MLPSAQLSHAPPLLSDRISQRNFSALARYIHETAGIRMPPSKKTMLEGRLRRRQRAIGAATLDDYCDYLFAEENIEFESEFLINAVTTNKTDFFREAYHFDYLRNVALPGLIERGVTRLRAWSVACSTGAEPYTMAMTIDDAFAGTSGASFTILATDLDTEVLEIARSGIYPAEFADPVPPALRKRYLMTSCDPARQEVRIIPALRRNVAFARLNLMDRNYPVGEPMDVVFCRNVLIYFDRETQLKVVSRIVEKMAPGGLLFLGHSETIVGHDLPIAQIGNTIFQRS
ncbi:CheR family methyltransferase [Sphingomonas glaciei]|uniref:Chemotaxis protein methyltransferase n=1 Tax=Sphingomonas glaciei TaxID=2938948 RepID=A0ABY5MW35_9SPHN|nr:CheR family methyltransferase [Sphingomonas glaciei]UUR08332.1 chemotaxis protein CheR [Sphingomonas glaciei]